MEVHTVMAIQSRSARFISDDQRFSYYTDFVIKPGLQRWDCMKEETSEGGVLDSWGNNCADKSCSLPWKASTVTSLSRIVVDLLKRSEKVK